MQNFYQHSIFPADYHFGFVYAKVNADVNIGCANVSITNALIGNVGDGTCLRLELHLTTSELWFGREQEGILPELLCSCSFVFLSSSQILSARFGFISLGSLTVLRSLCVC